MRKVDVEAKPEIDLQRKINVEVTLHELLLLTAAQGKSTKSKVGEFLNRRFSNCGGDSLIPDRMDSSLYEDLLTILANEGVKEDE